MGASPNPPFESVASANARLAKSATGTLFLVRGAEIGCTPSQGDSRNTGGLAARTRGSVTFEYGKFTIKSAECPRRSSVISQGRSTCFNRAAKNLLNSERQLASLGTTERA